MRRPKDYLLLYLKGVGVGVGDLIPGVSGGTIAFITGIYEELIHSIAAIDLTALRLLGTFQFAAFWKKINGNFLACVIAGICTSVVIFYNLIRFLQKNNPISTSSFFLGVILVSAPLILRQIKKWSIATVVALLMGAIAAYYITVIAPADVSNNLLVIFICGVLTVSAAMLPGISAIFVLLLLAKYELMTTALLNFNIPVISAFLAGNVAGIVAFSRFLDAMLTRYRFITFAALAGIMIGSLNRLWPWKIVTAFRLDLHGVQIPAFEKNVWPGQVNNDPHLFHAILFVAVGIFLVVAIEKATGYIKSKN